MASPPNENSHDAVPGRSAALRETNASGGGKDRHETSIQWKPKDLHLQNAHNDEELPQTNSHTTPEVGDIPEDFADIGFTAMEAPLCNLVSNTADWPYVEPSTKSNPWHGRAILTERQASLGTWWGQVQPELHSMVEPWVMRYVGASERPFPITLLMGALKAPPHSGSSKQQLLAIEASGVYTHRKDGHQRVTRPYWGKVFRHGDFTAQELTIA